MVRLLLSPRHGAPSTPILAAAAAAFITLGIIFLLRAEGQTAAFTAAGGSFAFTTSKSSGLNLDAISTTAQYFVDYPLKAPYKNVFGELGERVKVLRSWMEALEEEEEEEENGGGGGWGGKQKPRLSGAEKDFLAGEVERVAASLFPFLKSPPRNPSSRTPLADLRRSFQADAAAAAATAAATSTSTSTSAPVDDAEKAAQSLVETAMNDAVVNKRRGSGGRRAAAAAAAGSRRNAGIVIPTGRGTLRYACHLIAALKGVHGTELPIQVVYAGEADLPAADRRAMVSSTGHAVEFLDVLSVFDDESLKLAEGGWALKPFAALGSRFEEVILLDADAVFLQRPEKLLEQLGYRDKGALLFHDRLLWKNQFPQRHEWFHETFKRPGEELRKSLVWTQRYSEEQDSGVVVLDKGRPDVLLALLHVGWQNSAAVRTAWTYKIMYGDKETWWIGLEATGAAYTFSRHYGGIVGWRAAAPGTTAAGGGGGGARTEMAKVCSFVIAHVDEADSLLWYNGGLLKNKLSDGLEFEVPTHWMIDQTWVKGARKKDMSCMVGMEAHELAEHEKDVLARSIDAARVVDRLLGVT